ncbi:MAG: hypothetical protein NTX53_04025 [candidate division WOR-3 bacterium]|nr:hypothetical protein [candidate division WOR-3 bacterium]
MSRRAGTIVRVLIWTAVGMLLATPKSRPWPVEVSVSAGSDTTVVVTWFSREDYHGFSCCHPGPNPYDSFELFFQPLGETPWTSIGRTRDTFMPHDPQHRVGHYSVRGWRGVEEHWNLENQCTTEPLHIGPVTLHEVGTGDTSALGFQYFWNRGGHVYVMDTTTLDTAPDMYVTDYKRGSSGPLLLASPSLAFADPGLLVSGHKRSWHTTWFSAPLSDDQSLLPRWDMSTWAQVCSLPYTPLWVACRREGGNYALITVLSMGSTSIELEAWYQQINGLRLVGH